jgi:quercetin dioxygenase-like cupin family protein
MCAHHFLRFVTDAECEVEQLPWGPHEWLCKAGLTDAKQLQVVRVRMPPGKCHAFHRHPEFEEALVILDGRVEQWVGTQKRILHAGELAHVPTNEVHGSYNVFRTPVTFLAILSPATCKGPPLVDVSFEEPWRSLAPMVPPARS